MIPLTQQEYNLKCRVEIKRLTYKEIADGRQHEADCVLLIPDHEATETMKFFTAWLPDTIDTYHEVPSYVLHPINSPCRMAVLRNDELDGFHHLFVMSTGIEEILKRRNGQSVFVRILPEADDEICDKAPTLTRTTDKRFG